MRGQTHQAAEPVRNRAAAGPAAKAARPKVLSPAGPAPAPAVPPPGGDSPGSIIAGSRRVVLQARRTRALFAGLNALTSESSNLDSDPEPGAAPTPMPEPAMAQRRPRKPARRSGPGRRRSVGRAFHRRWDDDDDDEEEDEVGGGWGGSVLAEFKLVRDSTTGRVREVPKTYELAPDESEVGQQDPNAAREIDPQWGAPRPAPEQQSARKRSRRSRSRPKRQPARPRGGRGKRRRR